MNKVKSWVNGVKAIELSVLDRGLQYGDGFFTTMLIKRQRILNSKCHWQRLEESAKRLNFPDINLDNIKNDCYAICKDLDKDAVEVLKIIVTRGIGGRGYKPLKKNIVPTVIIQLLPYTLKYESTTKALSYSWQDWNFWKYSESIELGIVKSRWGTNSKLAGLKHLNRLENVLAQQEILDSKVDWQEGLMFDEVGNLISATHSNVVIYINGEWLTPNLSYSGVMGTTLSQIMKLCVIKFNSIKLEHLYQAEGMFCCNSVRGIMAVSKCHLSIDGKLNSMVLNTNLVKPIKQTWQSFLEKGN